MRCACGCEFDPVPAGRRVAANVLRCPDCGKAVHVPPPGAASSVTELQPMESKDHGTSIPGLDPHAPPLEQRPTEVPIVGISHDSMGPQSIEELEALSGLNWKIGDTVLERFHIREIRAGGMGVVYIAEDRALARDVAIKTLQKRCLERPGSVDRFLKECIIWIRLTERHPNIVQAYFARRYGDFPLLFLEYVDGMSLRARMRDARLRIEACLDIAMQISFGLLYAWERHFVVHRDIKPENILMMKGGIAKITDFGLATINSEALNLVAQATAREPEAARAPAVRPADETPGMRGGSRLTQVGEIVGTIPYMSPEQVQGERPLDTRSDIYSFGLTLYEMLTHRHPFYGTSLSGLPSAILYDQPPPPSEVSGTLRELPIARDLDRLVMRCLEKDPDRRYADFDDLLDDLERLGHAVGVEPPFDIDKRFMLIGPKEWQEKIASLRELGAEQDAKEAEEESAFQAALGLDDPKARPHVITRGERRRRPRTEKKNTVLRQIGARQLLCVFELPLPTYDPDLLIRQLEINGWFAERSPVWGKELAACDGYVVRIFRSGGADRGLEASPSLIQGCASETVLLNQPRVLAELPTFYLAREWREVTRDQELQRVRAMLATRAQQMAPDERLVLRDFDYLIGKVVLADYREAQRTDPVEYASGTVAIDVSIRAGGTFPTLREFWDETVAPALATNRPREAWKALWKLSACLRDYRTRLSEGTNADLTPDLLHLIASYMYMLGSCPGLRDLSRPFPHLELKLRRGADPIGRPLAPEVGPYLDPYLYGGLGTETLPLPLQSGKLAAWEKWTGKISLPVTILAVRQAARRPDDKKGKSADPDEEPPTEE